MLKRHYEHKINIGKELFLEKIFFDDQFNKWLFLDKLGMIEYDLIDHKSDGTKIYRKVKVKPKQTIPSFVKSILKEDFFYYEEGIYDKNIDKYIVKTKSSTFADKVNVNGMIYVNPAGNENCYRIADLEINVKIPLIGTKIEKHLADELDNSYDKAALATNEWISKKQGKL